MLSLMRIVTCAVLLVGMVMALPVLAVETDPVAAFPYRYASFDVKVAWNTDLSGDKLIVNGLIKNIRYAQIEDIDVTVSLLDNDGKVIAVGGALPIPIALKSYDYESFSAPLKGGGLRPGSKLQFVIRYRVNEGDQDNYTWMSSFTADAATGAILNRQPQTSNSW